MKRKFTYTLVLRDRAKAKTQQVSMLAPKRAKKLKKKLLLALSPKQETFEDAPRWEVTLVRQPYFEYEDEDFVHVDVDFHDEGAVDDLRQEVYACVEGSENIWRIYVDDAGNELPDTRTYTVDIVPHLAESALAQLKAMKCIKALRPSVTLPTFSLEHFRNNDPSVGPEVKLSPSSPDSALVA